MTGELVNLDGLGTAFIYIADKLGYTVQQIYTIYVSAQKTIAILSIADSLVQILLTLGILYTAWLIYSKYSIKERNYGVDNLPLVIAIVIGGLIMWLLMMIATNSIEVALIKYICPEYSAIKEMLSTFKQFI